MIGQMATVEADMDAMTAELVDRQDELLAIYDLIRSTRSQLDLHLTLGTLARQMARLLKASLGFAMVRTANGQHCSPPRRPGGSTATRLAVVEGVQGGRAATCSCHRRCSRAGHLAVHATCWRCPCRWGRHSPESAWP